MSASCGHSHEFDGSDPAFKKVLIFVAIINLAMFVVEMTAGAISGSQALKADALDFLADGITYSISLAVIGLSLRTRSLAAMAKGTSLLLMGCWVFGTTVYSVFYLHVPQAGLMGGIGVLAFIANIVSVLLLMKWREGDANVRSVWLCSRNDAIGNLIVVVAALGVFGTGTAWPDLIVAGIMASLFLSSAFQIFRPALKELKTDEKAQDSCCPVDDHHGHSH